MEFFPHLVRPASPASRIRPDYRCESGARDAVRVQMIPGVGDLSALAGGADAVLRPVEEDGRLGYVERARAALEHLWNMNVVDAWGPLVIRRVRRCCAARMISLGW